MTSSNPFIDRVRLRNRAYDAAVNRLIDLHISDWNRIYGEEARRVGIEPRGPRKPKPPQHHASNS